MAKSIEEQVEEYYKTYLKKLGVTYYGKTQASEMSESIANALNKAPSKSGGTGNNRPDIMVMLNDDKLNRHIPVFIEVKGSKNKLEKLKDNAIVQTVPFASDSKENAKNPHKKGDPNNTAIQKFAVNGALHYANTIIRDANCDYDEVIFIGVNGTKLTKDNVLSDPEQKAYYLSRKNKFQPKHIEEFDNGFDLMKDSNLSKLMDALDKLGLSEHEIEALTLKTEDELEKAVKKIHQEIYDNESLKTTLTTNEKLYLFSGLIIAGLQSKGVSRLTPEELKGNSSKNRNDGTEIISHISDFLDDRGASNEKVLMVKNLLKPVFEYNFLWENKNGESLLKHLFTDVYSDIIPLLESDLQLDFTGKILNSLNDWVHIDNDKANDVVLTPRYVTNLMVKLAHTDKDSYVWDTAMGSGGFLVSAMSEMIKDARQSIQDEEKLNKKIKHIKEQQLLGIEILGNIYILAIINMILMGDGSSNMRNGDSHQLYDNLTFSDSDTDFPANVFLLNPPYSAEGKGFNFVKEALLKMTKGYGAVLIQENAGSGQGLPYTSDILEKNTLVASIHMPNDLFNGKSSVQAAIYVFEVGKSHNPKSAVKFIDFSEDGYSRQNRKKSSQSVNLRDVDNAKARYQELVDIVLGNVPDTQYYTKENGKLIEDKISLKGDDWTFNQHVVIDTTPTEEDFKRTVTDYLAWKVSSILKNGGDY